MEATEKGSKLGTECSHPLQYFVKCMVTINKLFIFHFIYKVWMTNNSFMVKKKFETEGQWTLTLYNMIEIFCGKKKNVEEGGGCYEVLNTLL